MLCKEKVLSFWVWLCVWQEKEKKKKERETKASALKLFSLDRYKEKFQK